MFQSKNRRAASHGPLARKRCKSLVEHLEPRTLLSVSATAQIALASTSGSMASPIYHYDITVTDTGTTNIGTFWFAWIPGEDFLPTAPITEANPTGWGSALTGTHNSSDGSAIQWIATSNFITPGNSLGGFDFTSSDSPTALAAQSPTHPASPATASFVYSGGPFSDGGFQLTATPPATLAASTTTVVASQPTINLGDSVTFTATVVPTSGSGTDPSGSVTFLENGTSIGSGALVNGSAALVTTTLPIGSLSITAQYAGDSNYSPGASPVITETVNPPAPTTTALVTSTGSAQAGTPVTLTATVAPVTVTGTAPTGSVTFTDNGVTIGTVPVQGDGTAQLVTATLPVGTDQIVASYGGDAKFAASVSAASTEIVTPGIAPTTTALATSAPSIHSGDSVSFTATVAAVIPGGATPTGSVSFTQDGNALGSSPVQSDGTAVLSTATLPLGADNITATYGGDATYASSASTAVVESVTTPDTLVPTIAKSTIPAALVAGAAAHGVVTFSIANDTAAAIKGKITLEVFATTNGVIDGSAIMLAHVVKSLNVKTTKPATASLPVKIAPATLPAGTYTLVARVVDLTGNNNDSAAGPALTVAPPFFALTEVFKKMTIPSTAIAGAKAHAVAALRITNNGNITTPAMTTAALYLTLTGVIDGSAVPINSVTKPLHIRVGKSVVLTIPVKQIPLTGVGAYTIVAQVTDPNGQITTATSGVVNIAIS